MKRIAGYFLLLILLSLSVQAAGPLAFIAKDLVKGIVRGFVEGQLNQMLASAGPCGLPIAGPGASGLAGMVGRGGMPGIGSIPGAGSMRLSGAAGMARGTLPSVPGMPAGMTMPPGMDRMMKEQMAQAQAMMAQEQAKHGAQDDEDGTPGTAPDMAAAMQAMQDASPLTSAEVDELGTLLERMSTAMPSAALPCKPGELKLALKQVADEPMVSGVLRMMLGPMRDMQQKLDEARVTFANMSESERGEYVDTMAAEFRGWDKDNKQALLGMVETNFLGMPDTMKTQLLARLKQK